MPPTRRPKLGQHFLSSEAYRRRIVDAIGLRADDLVIEIGPGRGAMTELLAQRAGRLVAVELDGKLSGALREKLSALSKIEIITGDILATDFAALCRERHAERCFVFGNLPYYITSPIIHHVLDSARSIRAMALLVQREVAERLVAPPGSREFGYLTVLAQLHSQPRIALAVPPGAFSPPPKVHSSLVDFVMRPKFPDWTAAQRGRFLEFVQRCFAQKRKNLLNNLGITCGRERIAAALDQLRLPATSRAEEISIEQFAALFARL